MLVLQKKKYYKITSSSLLECSYLDYKGLLLRKERSDVIVVDDDNVAFNVVVAQFGINHGSPRFLMTSYGCIISTIIISRHCKVDS